MQWHSSLASRAAPLLTVLAVLLSGTGLLSGCGQKGPLTLPKPPAGAASAPNK